MENFTSFIRVSLLATVLVTALSTIAHAMPDDAMEAQCPLKHGFVGKQIGEHHQDPFQDILTGFYSSVVDKDWQNELMSSGCMYFATEAPDFSMATVLHMSKAKDKNTLIDAGWVELYFPRKDARSDHHKLDIPKSCYSNAGLKAMSFTQRISQCYYSSSASGATSYNTVSEVVRNTVDSLKYYYSKRTSVFQELKKIDSEFAEVSEVVERSLAIGRKTNNMTLVLKALGYNATLFNKNFWVKSRHRPGDAEFQKIVSAAMSLDAQGLMFIDTNYFDKNQGPAIIRQDELVPNQMIHLMGYDLNSDLHFAMEKAGFSYSPTWSFKPPVQNEID